jgi:hypothetical protein
MSNMLLYLSLSLELQEVDVMFSRSQAVGLIMAGMLLAPSVASADTYVPWSYTTAKTDRVANWEGLTWGSAQAGSSARVCGDVTGATSTNNVYVYYAIVRDIQILPDVEVAKRGSYGRDPVLCSGWASIIPDAGYYTRIFTNKESTPHPVWAEVRK